MRRFPDGGPAQEGEPPRTRLPDADTVAVGVAPSASPVAHTGNFYGWKRRSVVTAISAVFVIVAGVAFWLSSQRLSPRASSSHLKVFPLTGSIGGEADPAFSPDGKQLA